MTTFRRSDTGQRYSTAFFYLAFIALCLAFVLGLPASSSGQDYVPDEVLVGVRPDSDDVNASARLSNVGTSIEHQEPIHMHRLKLPKGTTVEATIAALIRHPEVAYAEPNYYFYLAATPNDATFSLQYGPRKVQANMAWAIWQPQSQVVIAVLDCWHR